MVSVVSDQCGHCGQRGQWSAWSVVSVVIVISVVTVMSMVSVVSVVIVVSVVSVVSVVIVISVVSGQRGHCAAGDDGEWSAVTQSFCDDDDISQSLNASKLTQTPTTTSCYNNVQLMSTIMTTHYKQNKFPITPHFKQMFLANGPPKRTTCQVT